MYCTISGAEAGQLAAGVSSFIHADHEDIGSKGAPGAQLPRNAKPAAKPLRILIVEDDFILQQDLRLSLIKAGYKVAGAAASAAEAFRLANETRPDLVIMDIRLQGKRDGVDAALEIFKTLGIQSIFASADVTKTTRLRAAEAKPLGWLSKPYDMAALVRLIAETGPRRLN